MEEPLYHLALSQVCHVERMTPGNNYSKRNNTGIPKNNYGDICAI